MNLAKALTWMDAVVNGVPVTPRGGYQSGNKCVVV